MPTLARPLVAVSVASALSGVAAPLASAAATAPDAKGIGWD
ncbi:hypothetical protein ACIO7M_24875 [Streptomyces toxytricini]|uniref:Uncharacterized protein n=1 Tax=Streptomyces toxytricini TaxID=67369 RepID=A0ABW8EM45_STRT5